MADVVAKCTFPGCYDRAPAHEEGARSNVCGICDSKFCCYEHWSMHLARFKDGSKNIVGAPMQYCPRRRAM